VAYGLGSGTWGDEELKAQGLGIPSQLEEESLIAAPETRERACSLGGIEATQVRAYDLKRLSPPEQIGELGHDESLSGLSGQRSR
jgi:hypothetical protein